MSLETPILFMVFNRPDTTSKVFEVIRAAKPKQLFVAADGPREGKEGEHERCEEVRKIATAIDWDCELHTLFRAKNLGCGHAPAEAITWFFQNVKQGIILEDDCIPGPSFFSFCTELLNRYKNNEHIMHISGNNFISKNYGHGESYYFNKYFTAWGWATWRRAWAKYDFTVPFLPAFLVSEKFEQLVLNEQQKRYWEMIAGLVAGGKRSDIWDYQWLFTCWNNDGLAITPVVNLVTNIGFGTEATHTVDDSKAAYVKSEQLQHLVHPSAIKRNKKVDNKTFVTYFEVSQRLNNLRSVMYKIFPASIMKQIQKLRRALFPNMK